MVPTKRDREDPPPRAREGGACAVLRPVNGVGVTLILRGGTRSRFDAAGRTNVTVQPETALS